MAHIIRTNVDDKTTCYNLDNYNVVIHTKPATLGLYAPSGHVGTVLYGDDAVEALHALPPAYTEGLDLPEKVTPDTAPAPALKIEDVPHANVKRAARTLLNPQARREAETEDKMAQALGSVAPEGMQLKLSPQALKPKYKVANTKNLNLGKVCYDDDAALGSTTRYWRCGCGDSSFIPHKVKHCSACDQDQNSKPIQYYTLLRAGVISFGMAKNQHTRDAKDAS